LGQSGSLVEANCSHRSKLDGGQLTQTEHGSTKSNPHSDLLVVTILVGANSTTLKFSSIGRGDLHNSLSTPVADRSKMSVAHLAKVKNPNFVTRLTKIMNRHFYYSF
jgi:hypothetical protein